MLRPQLPDIASCKSAHLLVRSQSIPNYHAGYSISNRQLNHSTSNFPLPENSPVPRTLKSHTYCLWTRGWRPFPSTLGRLLDRGSLLRVVSWNIDSIPVGRASQASSAMNHLEEVFGDPSSPLVVMLQEVHYESLPAILEHSWIRKNFALSHAHPPQRVFALIMVSHHVQPDRVFHIPFQSRTDGSALVVDIPISSPDGESEHPKRILRLCTTHLNPPQETGQEASRPRQLAPVSALAWQTANIHGRGG
jgi:hypothetical protein